MRGNVTAGHLIQTDGLARFPGQHDTELALQEKMGIRQLRRRRAFQDEEDFYARAPGLRAANTFWGHISTYL